MYTNKFVSLGTSDATLVDNLCSRPGDELNICSIRNLNVPIRTQFQRPVLVKWRLGASLMIAVKRNTEQYSRESDRLPAVDLVFRLTGGQSNVYFKAT